MATPFIHRLRVRYSECDAQGVVFNGQYLFFYDVALTELCRDRIGPYQEMVDRGVDVVVAEAFIQHDLNSAPLFPRYEIPFYGRSALDCDPALSALLLEAAQLGLAGMGEHFHRSLPLEAPRKTPEAKKRAASAAAKDRRKERRGERRSRGAPKAAPRR